MDVCILVVLPRFHSWQATKRYSNMRRNVIDVLYSSAQPLAALIVVFPFFSSTSKLYRAVTKSSVQENLKWDADADANLNLDKWRLFFGSVKMRMKWKFENCGMKRFQGWCNAVRYGREWKNFRRNRDSWCVDSFTSDVGSMTRYKPSAGKTIVRLPRHRDIAISEWWCQFHG